MWLCGVHHIHNVFKVTQLFITSLIHKFSDSRKGMHRHILNLALYKLGQGQEKTGQMVEKAKFYLEHSTGFINNRGWDHEWI